MIETQHKATLRLFNQRTVTHYEPETIEEMLDAFADDLPVSTNLTRVLQDIGRRIIAIEQQLGAPRHHSGS